MGTCYLPSNHLKCIVYITNYMDMDQHIVTCSHHYGIIECFHCPQNHLYSVRPLPHTPPLATTNHFTGSIILPFPECQSFHSSTCVCVCVHEQSQLLSHVQLFATPWTVAHDAPLSMEFSRQEYWSRLPFPSPGDLPNPGIKLRSLVSLHWQADSLPLESPFIYLRLYI